MSEHSVLKQLSAERVALVQAALPSVVAVIAGRHRVLSGILWRSDLIITAAEAIGGADKVHVLREGEPIAAEVLASDPATDIAVVRAGGLATGTSNVTKPPAVASPSAVAPAGDNVPRPAPRLGETIAVVGRTLRGPAAVWGSVQLSGPAWTSLRGGKIDQRMELDVGFHPELEGAPVIDLGGAVIAMAVPGAHQRVLGIPATTIESVVSEVDRFGRLPKPYLGIRLQPLWLDDHTRSRLGRKSRRIAAVGGVDAGSPAEQAHVELGDLLLTLNGEPAEGVNTLARRISATAPGQTVALEVLRGGKPLTLQVKVGERPAH